MVGSFTVIHIKRQSYHAVTMSAEQEYEDWGESFSAAEYQGRKVTLNKPFRTPNKNKKFAVYVKNSKGTVVIVRFGDPNMEIKRDDPKRRKAFRDRHNCSEKKDKTTAGYWSCRMWSNTPVNKMSSEFNKTNHTVSPTMGDCGCGDCGCEETLEAKMEDYIFLDIDGAIKKSQQIGFEGETHTSTTADGGTLYFPAKTEEEFITWYRENDPDAESELEGSYHNNSCGVGEKMQDGKCVRVAFHTDIDIKIEEVIIEASTGKQVIRISGIAFHQGVNKNGWEISRVGAGLTAQQMLGLDLTLSHPKAENGRFTRNMNGGVEEAVVGIVTEASVHDTPEGYNVRFIAEVHRSELFEALESGLWLREGYGVSIGGTGIPDSVTEHSDGITVYSFGSDFELDHLAIVHKPAYPNAKIESAEKVIITVAEDEAFNRHTPPVLEQAEEVITMTDEQIIIEASEEEVIEAPIASVTEDFASEIEALKASLAESELAVSEFKAAEEAKLEEVRTSLVSRATELGIAGHESLPSETITTLIASWEAKMIVETPKVEMKPIEAGETAPPIATSENVVSNFLNQKKLNTPEALYAKGYNVWANTWNKTYTEEGMKAPSYDEVKSKSLI
tara:strand:+ start:7585 stop:9435 length:1851 start_codon:yes stop_codon:yes gene_type:complete